MFLLLRKFFSRKVVRLNVTTNVKALVMFSGLVWFSSSGFLYFELPGKPDLGWVDSLWWTFVTMTTIGYGDYAPATAGGRYLVGLPTMIFGIGFLGYLISQIANVLIESRSRRLKGMADIKSKNHIVIINFTTEQEILVLVEELRADVKTRDLDIVLVDENLAETPDRLNRAGVLFVKGNPTSEEVLVRANMSEAGYAIILTRDRSDHHSDDQNLATVLVLEKLNPDIFTVVEVVEPSKVAQFRLTGCDSVVCVSEFTSNIIVKELQDPGVEKIVFELTTNRMGMQFNIDPLEAEKECSYRDLVLWGLDHGVTIVGLMREGSPLLNCCPDERVRPGDRIISIGDTRTRICVG